jgi:hypothetical protein
MIDILEKIEQLKSIAKMVDDGTPRYQIVDKCNEIINEDQKKVDEFEKWADEESKKEIAYSEVEDMAFGLDPWETTDLAKSVKN